MPSPSFGGDIHTKEEHRWSLQPISLHTLEWAGKPWDEERSVGEIEYEDDRLAYVRNQVIVTGRQDDVLAVVFEALGYAKMLREPIDLEELLPADILERFPGQGPLTINLYETGDLPVRRAVVLIHDRAVDMNKTVFADPNYVTGHPHIPVGSPHIPVGSGLKGVAETEDEFWGQWAFGEKSGIGLVSRGRRSGSLAYTGEGIRVAVFDTSPFPNSGFWAIDWIHPNLQLSVSHLLRPVHTKARTADHGLFVAGLVHAVAPDSQIELIQVLNEEAVGTLHTLNYAIRRFMHQRKLEHLGTANEGTLNDTVMNFSLGFPDPAGRAGLDPEVVCLKTLLHGAAALGATVVAAAGNASDSQNVEPPDVPAKYDFVIGVSASNEDKRRSCFSNGGDVAAPGGDTYDRRQRRCIDQLIVDSENNVQGAVIGLAPRTAPKSGYAYWVGTSFSAPLVSGLAALMLEHQSGVPVFGSIRVKPAALPPAPLDHALGKGIIDVPDSVT